jgi:hypothetical protein
MGIFHDVAAGTNKGMGPNPGEKASASQNTAVGSGSRPTKSSIGIMSSAPEDPLHLDGRGTGLSVTPMGAGDGPGKTE